MKKRRNTPWDLKGDTLFFDTEVEGPDIPFCRVFYLLEKNVCLFVFRSDTV